MDLKSGEFLLGFKRVYIIPSAVFIALHGHGGSDAPFHLRPVYALLFCQDKAVRCVCSAPRLQIAFEDEETEEAFCSGSE